MINNPPTHKEGQDALRRLDILLKRATGLTPSSDLVAARHCLAFESMIVLEAFAEHGRESFETNDRIEAWFEVIVDRQEYLTDPLAKVDVDIFQQPPFQTSDPAHVEETHIDQTLPEQQRPAERKELKDRGSPRKEKSREEGEQGGEDSGPVTDDESETRGSGRSDSESGTLRGEGEIGSEEDAPHESETSEDDDEDADRERKRKTPKGDEEVEIDEESDEEGGPSVPKKRRIGRSPTVTSEVPVPASESPMNEPSADSNDATKAKKARTGLLVYEGLEIYETPCERCRRTPYNQPCYKQPVTRSRGNRPKRMCLVCRKRKQKCSKTKAHDGNNPGNEADEEDYGEGDEAGEEDGEQNVDEGQDIDDGDEEDEEDEEDAFVVQEDDEDGEDEYVPPADEEDEDAGSEADPDYAVATDSDMAGEESKQAGKTTRGRGRVLRRKGGSKGKGRAHDRGVETGVESEGGERDKARDDSKPRRGRTETKRSQGRDMSGRGQDGRVKSGPSVAPNKGGEEDMSVDGSWIPPTTGLWVGTSTNSKSKQAMWDQGFHEDGFGRQVSMNMIRPSRSVSSHHSTHPTRVIKPLPSRRVSPSNALEFTEGDVHHQVTAIMGGLRSSNVKLAELSSEVRILQRTQVNQQTEINQLNVEQRLTARRHADRLSDLEDDVFDMGTKSVQPVFDRVSRLEDKVQTLESYVPRSKGKVVQASGEGNIVELFDQFKAEIKDILASSYTDVNQQNLSLQLNIGQHFESLTQGLAQLTLQQEVRAEEQYSMIMRRIHGLEARLGNSGAIESRPYRSTLTHALSDNMPQNSTTLKRWTTDRHQHTHTQPQPTHKPNHTLV